MRRDTGLENLIIDGKIQDKRPPDGSGQIQAALYETPRKKH